MKNDLPKTVMVVDDDATFRDAVCQALELHDLTALPMASAKAALDVLDPTFEGIVLLDLRMPEMDGTAMFARLKELDPELPIIIVTGHGDVMTVVDFMRRGAYDFLSKPFTSDSLLPSVHRALEKRGLVLENRSLHALPSNERSAGVLGTAPAIELARNAIRRLADRDLSVLILGETGTGKSHLSSLIHKRGPRSTKPFVIVNCAALPTDQTESHLFGHVSGAVPHSIGPKTGVLREAQRGTLVLEQLEQLPRELQSKLALALESSAITPVGSSSPIPMEARIIATGSPALPELMKRGEFDANLFYRVAGFTMNLPSLRERGEDTISLFKSFLQDAAEASNLPMPALGPLVWKRLREHDWPGNVRELKSFAEAVALGLDQPKAQNTASLETTMDGGLRSAVSEYEAGLLRQVLDHCSGDVAKALEMVKLPRKTFYDKLNRHSISPAEYRG